MVPGCGASVGGVTAEKIPLWKNNKKVLQCQTNSGLSSGKNEAR
jgi:hypothetical protein